MGLFPAIQMKKKRNGLAAAILLAAAQQGTATEGKNDTDYDTADRESPQTYTVIVTDTLGNAAEYVLTEDNMLFRDGEPIAAEEKNIETIRALIREALSD